ncbi:MAG: hypothetical protein JNJ54_36355 [Myxococcaceae bacterium]|nr:hypothetical protein [Myxococcaceae bacterium]
MATRSLWSTLDPAQVAELERLAGAGPSEYFHPTHGWALALHLVPALVLVAVAVGVLRWEASRWPCGVGHGTVVVPGAVTLALALAAVGWVALLAFERFSGGARNGWYVTDAGLVHRQGPVVERYAFTEVVPIGFEFIETSTQWLRGKQLFTRPRDLTDRALVQTSPGEVRASGEWLFGVEGTDRRVVITDAHGDAFSSFLASLMARVRQAGAAQSPDPAGTWWPAWPAWLGAIALAALVAGLAGFAALAPFLERLKFAAERDALVALHGADSPAALEAQEVSHLESEHLLTLHAPLLDGPTRALAERLSVAAAEDDAERLRHELAQALERGEPWAPSALRARLESAVVRTPAITDELSRLSDAQAWSAWWRAEALARWRRLAAADDAERLWLRLVGPGVDVSLSRAVDEGHRWELMIDQTTTPTDASMRARLSSLVLEAQAADGPHRLEVGAGGYFFTVPGAHADLIAFVQAHRKRQGAR